jgi:hypothetical protein
MKEDMPVRKALLILGLAIGIGSTAAAAEQSEATALANGFAIRDGDRVVFLGDSITEQRLYTAYVEAYWLTRHPQYKLSFRNVGWGGDTAWMRQRVKTDKDAMYAAAPEVQQAMVERAVAAGLGRDVLPLKPTVVTIDYGMNDHEYQAFRPDICKTYVRSQTQLTRVLKASGARVALITTQPIEDRRPDPDQDVRNQSLRKFADALRGVAANEHVPFVDQFRPYMAVMMEARAATPNAFVGGGDSLHPGPAGQLIMAWSILKGLGMPSLVSRVELDVARSPGQQVVTMEHARVSNVTWESGALAFDRLDSALPMPVDERAEPALEMIPFLRDLDRYELKVTGLQGDYYDVKINGESIGGVSRNDLAKGWNMVMMPGPVTSQAQKLLQAVFKKNDLYFERWRKCQLNAQLTGDGTVMFDDQGRSILHPDLDRIPELDWQIAAWEAKIDAARRPTTHRVALVPTTRAIVPEVPLAALAGKDAPAGAIWLDTLDVSPVKVGYGTVGAGKAVTGKNPITIDKQVFVHGIGVHAASVAEIDLAGKATRFVAAVGVDNQAGPPGVGSVVFQVWVDGVKKTSSGLMRCGDAPKVLSVDLRGARKLKLVVTDGGDGPACDHADWGGAAVFATGNAVKIVPDTEDK